MKGVTYEILMLGENCTAEDVIATNKKLLGSILFHFLKPKISSHSYA